jgi:hypothetical protein
VVIESKWNSDAWLSPEASEFTAGRLREAVEQTGRNRRYVESQFRRAAAGSPVLGALVLHSPIGVPGRPAAWHDDPTGVTIIEGGALKRWLKSLDGQALDKAGVRRLWEVAEKFAASRDKHDEAAGTTPRRTLNQLEWAFVLGPLCGLYAAGYYVRLLTSVAHGWPAFAGLVVGFGAGWLASRATILHGAMLLWMSVTALFGVAWLADFAIAALR